MAAITHFVKRDATTRTTASTTAVELTDYTITWANLTGAGLAAGDDVFIMVGVKTWNSSANAQTAFCVGFGTTFAGRTEDTTSEQIAEPVATFNGDQYLWIDRRTLVTDENIYFRGLATASTASYDEFVCVILKLDDLAANDFLYAETAHGGNAPTSFDTSGAGVTTAASGDWFFIAGSRWLSDSTTAKLIVGIHDGTTDMVTCHCVPGDTNDQQVWGTMTYKAALGSGVTVRTRYRSDASNSHDCETTKIFGLRLDAFEDHDGSYTANTITHSVVDTFQEFAGFGSYGLTTTGPFMVIGWPMHLLTETAKRPYGRIQIGGADWPAANDNRTAVADNSSSARLAPLLFGYNASQTAGTLDIDLDCAEDADVSPTYTCHEQVAVAFSLTLAVSEAEMAGTPQAVGATADGELDNRPQMSGDPQADAAAADGVANHRFSLAGTPQAANATADGTLEALPARVLSGAPQAPRATSIGELDLWAQMAGDPDAIDATVDGVLDLIAQLDGAVVANAVVASGTMATTTESVMSGTVQADPAATVVAEMLAIASAAGVPQAAIASSEGVAVVWLQMSGTPQALFATTEGELILLGVRTMTGVPQALTATVIGTAEADQPEVDMGVQQGLRHASFRTIGGGTGTYGGDAMAAFAAEATIPAGASFNGAFVEWLQARLSSTDQNLDNLMQAFAEAEGAHNWSSLGSFDPVP